LTLNATHFISARWVR